MLFNASEKYPHKNFQKEYGKLKTCSQVHHLTITFVASESDFSDGESWGYRKFYDLSKLASA